MRELSEQYPYVVCYSFEGILDTQAAIYYEKFTEARNIFRDILQKVMDEEDEDAEPHFFPQGEEKAKFLIACSVVGEWQSGASWEISLMPSKGRCLLDEERQEFMVNNGIPPSSYREALEIVNSFEIEW